VRRRGTRTQKNVERDRAILEVIPDMFFIFASDGTLLDYKPAKDQEPLFPPSDFIGKRIGDILPPDISKKTTQSIGQALQAGKEQIFQYRLPLEGKIHHYETRMIPFGEKEALAIVRDVTERVRADETIKMGEERFQNLFGQTADALFLHDSQGKILDLNRAAFQTLGYTFEELLNGNISTFAEAFSPERLEKLTGDLKIGEAATFEGTHRRKDGTSYPVSVRIVIFDSGEDKLYLATTRDISEIKRTEKNLQESESRYRRLFENNPLPMYIYDMETLNILEVNETFVSRYGYARDEILNVTIKDIRPKEEFDRLIPHIRDLEPGMLYTGLWKHVRKDGTVIDVDITSTDFPYQNKRARLVLCNDITEKLRVEEELRESESRYRRLFEDNPMPMMIFEPETLRFLAVNEAAEVHYGWTRNEFLNMTIKDIRPPEDVQSAVEYIQGMDHGLDKVGVRRHRKKDGTVIYVDINSHSLKYQGKSAWLALCQDITERVQAEEIIRKSEERYRLLADNVTDIIWILDLDFRYKYITPSVTRLRGYEPDELVGSSLMDLLSPESREMVLEEYARELQAEKNPNADPNRSVTLELEQGCKDGSTIWTEVKVKFLRDSQGIAQGLVGVTRDISDKKQAEEALRESEERFRTSFMTTPDSISIHKGPDGVFVDVNEAFCVITGYSKEDVVGREANEVHIWDDPDDRKRFVERLTKDGKVQNFEAKFRMKNGNVRFGLLSATAIMLQGEMHHISITRDITDMKAAEERIKSSLKEKEILLKEVHHRVKNNLQVISGLLNLQAHHITDPGAREVYKESQNRVITMGLIHEELYQSKDLAQVDFAAYIQNLSSNLFASYGKEHSNVDLVLDAEHIEMIVDTAIPCGLIVNELISNSLKHAFPMEKEGEVRVDFHSLGNGVYRLSVADSGVGLPEGFDFRRSKSLGLQLVTVMTELLGGTIELNRDGGTTFIITFREYREAGTELH
jgi:PAS domain S-box-containing protein